MVFGLLPVRYATNENVCTEMLVVGGQTEIVIALASAF